MSKHELLTSVFLDADFNQISFSSGGRGVKQAAKPIVIKERHRYKLMINYRLKPGQIPASQGWQPSLADEMHNIEK